MKNILFAFSTLSFLLTACGTSALAANQEPIEIGVPESVEFTIDMSEFAFSPNDIELHVGQEVTLVLVNVGQLEHEFMIGRGVDTNMMMPTGFATDFFEAGGVEPIIESDGHDGEHDVEASIDLGGMGMGGMDMMDTGDDDHGGFMALVQPGQIVEISFTVTEGMLGEWEMGCFLMNGMHYTAGMVGSLTVTK